MLCEYALNGNGKLVFVDDVENGVKCNCTCPSCGEKMVAKNNGEIKDHHFAHSSGSDCAEYKETLLHIWSKQIIEEKKKFTIPKYKNLISSKKIKFSSVEIEQMNDTKLLRPDIVGVTDDGLRLWVEIVVTHKCSEEKKQCIKENGYNCIEVKIPEEIETKEKLSEFLANSDDSNFKYFINFPYGDVIYQPFIEEFYPMYLEWKKNGVHGITAVERRKEFKLFDNLIHKGLPYSQWPEKWKNMYPDAPNDEINSN